MPDKKAAPQAKSDATAGDASKKTSIKTILAFFFCFLFSVSASVAATYYLLTLKEAPLLTEETDTTLEQQLTSLQSEVARQKQTIEAVQAENQTLKLYLRHSSSTALKNILIDQENNIQAYLKVMKAAMEELTKLTSGTRDWNNKYQYQLDLALKGSLEREDLLKLLKTGEPNENK
ncbi:hypothetical protein [Marinomonas pollencensis]|uniref:Uncharacterized protein n=1 Tax=Marinomonas pollencensis TaxID=491954 RepID=A0A3E0DI07_9GAMM|nr:hypothetical protein [Marinomonas pollencensis]REG82245.1 hypothetical protein DFP81_110133 [Marinomonas pollencensis]